MSSVFTLRGRSKETLLLADSHYLIDTDIVRMVDDLARGDMQLGALEGAHPRPSIMIPSSSHFKAQHHGRIRLVASKEICRFVVWVLY